MNIALYNLEPQYTNIALEKIRAYYELDDHTVENYLPLKHKEYDKIYCSSIFTNTPKDTTRPDMICGGTGFNLQGTLPAAMDAMNPKINIGFTSRGCIRRCEFCVVPEKEGTIHVTGDIYNLWDRRTKAITLLDNNILALPDHFALICYQVCSENIRVDFNQGLDHRLLTRETALILKKTKQDTIKFALDSTASLQTAERAIIILQEYRIRALWYVLVGYDETLEQDRARIEFINQSGQRAYAMRHENVRGNRLYNELARWTNGPLWRNKMSFEDFLKANKRTHLLEER